MQKSTEVLGGLVVGHKSDGRCTYDPQVKQELIRQCLKPGVSVARMAMQHGVNTNLLRTWIKCIEKSTISVTPMAVEDPHLGRARIKTTATAAFASAVSCSRPSRYSEHYRRDDSTDPSDRSRRALPYRYKSKQSSVFFLTSFVVSPPTRGRERESCSDAIVRSTRERPASQVPRRCFSPLPPFGHRGRCR